MLLFSSSMDDDFASGDDQEKEEGTEPTTTQTAMISFPLQFRIFKKLKTERCYSLCLQMI